MATAGFRACSKRNSERRTYDPDGGTGSAHRRQPRHPGPPGPRKDLQELAHRSRLPHAPEQPGPGSGGEPQGPGGLRRHRPGRAQLGLLRRHPRRAEEARGRRDPADPVRQARGRLQDPRRRAPGADRQFQPGAALGHLGEVPRAGPQGPVHVRPDDRRIVDLHRRPGHRPGHLRDLRRGRPPALRAATGPGAGSSPRAWAAWAGPSRWPRPWPARCP